MTQPGVPPRVPCAPCMSDCTCEPIDPPDMRALRHDGDGNGDGDTPATTREPAAEAAQ